MENKKSLPISNDLSVILAQNALFNSGNLVLFKWKNAPGFPVEFVSENIVKLLGYGVDEIVSGDIPFSSLLNEFDLPRIHQEVIDGMASDEISFNHSPYRLQKKDDSFIWVNDYTVKILDESGRIDSLIGYLYDITSIKEGEEKLAQAYNDMEWKSWELETAKKNLEIEVALRLESEKKAIENEEKLNNILNAIEDIVWSLNYPEYSIIYISNSIERIYQRKIEDLYENGRLLLEQIHDDDRELVQSKFNESLLINEQDLEYRIVQPNGNVRWVRTRFKVSQNEHTNKIRLDGITNDITDRKLSETALKISEERFRLLADNMLDLVALHSLDGTYLYLSPSVEKLLGYTADELIGTSPYDYFHPDDLLRISEESHAKAKQGLEIVYIQYRIRIKSGDYIWFETNTNPIKNAEGEVIQLQTVSRDITERKAVEDQMQELSEEYQIIFHGTQDALFMIDVIDESNFKYIRNNETHIELTGLSLDQVRGKTTEEIFGAEQSPALVENYIHCVQAKTPIQYEETIDLPAGKKTWITTLSPITRDGKIKFIIGSSQDITRRKLAEDSLLNALEDIKLSNNSLEAALTQKDTLIEQLEATQEQLHNINSEKDKFFSIIAHDLKNPFSGFLGLTQIMSEQMLDLSMRELQSFAVDLQESASNLYKLLENLLEWSRMQRGITSFNPDRFPLSKIVEQNISYIVQKAKQKGINLTNTVDENIFVWIDLQMIDTVLRNLISNSVKFTPKGGNIEIGAEYIDLSTVSVFVKDNGIGMSGDMIGKLFQIDQKVSRAGTDGEASTGLGLLLCHEFILKNGGEINVESKVGEGSIFSFTLPLASPQDYEE